MIPILLFIGSVVGACCGIGLGWRDYAASKHLQFGPRWRWRLSLIGLVAVTAQLLLFVGFEVYGQLIGGFSRDYHAFYTWGRLSSLLFIIALVAAVVGRGKLRWLALLSSAALAAAWFMLALAQ